MKNYFSNQNIQRFSIRKYSFGAASVLLGTFLLLSAQPISADEQTVADSTSTNVIDNNSVETSNTTQPAAATMVKEEIVSESDAQIVAATVDADNVATSTENISSPVNISEAPVKDSDQVVVSEKETSADIVIETNQRSFDGGDNIWAAREAHNLADEESSVISDSGARLTMGNSVTLEVPVDNIEVPSKFLENSYPEEITDVDVKSITNKLESKKTLNLSKFFMTSFAVSENSGSIARGDDYPSNLKNAAPDTVIDPWRLFNRECTSFTAYRLSSVNHFTLPGAYGNGAQWGGRARQEGYIVDMNPAKGAVAWLNDGGYGHVAWVSNVIGSDVEIEEYNYNWNHNYNKRVVAKTSFTGFIHFKDLTGGGTSGGSSSGGTSSGSSLPSSGTYHFTSRVGIKAEPKISSPDIAYYDNGSSVNYDKTLEADNYQWISYVSYSGARRYIAINKLASSVTPEVKGKINIQNKNDQAGTFEVVITNVSSNCGLKEVKVPVWSSQNGQDDLIWYNASKQNDGTYKAAVNISEHKNNRGEYNIHLYYVVDSGKMIGVGGTTTTISDVKPSEQKLSGTISIVNKNNQTGTFDVVISNISSPNGVKEVKVPTWATQNGQDDIIWYNASRQGDGTYKVTVKASEHKNYQGEYNIHLYYVQNDGKMIGVTGTTTTVSFVARPSIPDSGTYRFTGHASIKAEPKMSAAELAYYDAGNTVNYDKVLLSDGHYWISYIAASGNRRYISIT
ncbi:GBS Bsp-like repeat-containing protein [Streptococcus orisratti]|uniref:GBS Bsp-like repeat-containing protein n=1 Tax=Streptococcus orisratti TaxID=114652 RepID=UPI003D07CA8A